MIQRVHGDAKVTGGLLLIGAGIALLRLVGARQVGGVAIATGVLVSAVYFALRGLALATHYGLSSLRVIANIVAAVLAIVIGCFTLAAIALGLLDDGNALATFLLDQLPNLGIAYAAVAVVAVLLDSDRMLD